MRRIAVVGGGPGGLFTALLLGQKCAEPPEITLFESSARLGGKVLTRRFDAVPVPYEAGAAELYQYGDDPLRLLVKEILGLSVVPMGGRTVILDGRILRTPADIARHYGGATVQALKQFDKLAHRARPYETFYDGSLCEDNEHPLMGRSFASLLGEVPDENARRYLRVLVHSDLAAEPHAITALYGVDNYLMNDPRYCELYSIQGGMDRLIDALCRRIVATVRLETPVERIEKVGATAYRVVARHGGAVQSEEFDAVVVALPHSWLPNLAWGSRRLEAAINAHIAHYDFPAHYLRISLLYREPFWRELIDESYFMIDAFGGCCVYDEGARHDTRGHGVLAWLVAGNHASAAANLSDEQLIARALDALPAELAWGRALFLEGRVHRWLGSVSARPGGRRIQEINQRHVPEPVEHPGLFLVGDYMFDTSINGALDSADYATDLVMEQLGMAPAILDGLYFDNYVDDECYADTFEQAFDARCVAELVAAAWGARPPYRLLDAGAACGLTLRALDALGIDAWGVENNPFIHAQTPRRWKNKNLLAHVQNLPFEDDAFDFVYETCLAYVPVHDVDRAIRELHRVARRGVLLGSVVREMRPEAVARYDLHYGVQNLLSLEQWTERFLREGFRPAINDSRTAARVWGTRTRAYGGRHLYPSAQAMSLCFFTKQAVRPILSLPESTPTPLVAVPRATG
jgi:protoporphyrinogen oxidase/SAM-dependent methyltransferase